MNLTLNAAAEIAIRTLGEEDRRKVHALIDHLRLWDTDPSVRSLARSLDLPDAENVYVLRTSTDLGIFFEIEKDSIEVIDVARRASLDKVRRAS